MLEYEDLVNFDFHVSKIKTVAVFSYPPGWQLLLAKKENAAFYYITEGEFTVTVDGKAHTAPKNHLISLSKGKDYLMANRSNAVIRMIHFTFYSEGPFDFEDLNVPLVLSDEKEKYRWRFEAALRLYWDRTVAYSISIRSKLLAILYEVIQDSNSQVRTPGDRSKQVVGIACDYIENNYRNPITLDDICDQAHYSPSRLRSLFYRQMQCSPMHYLNRFRLAQAQKELVLSERSIEEIALRSGFSGSSHFCHYFKEKCGCTPSEYREKMTKDRSKRMIEEKDK